MLENYVRFIRGNSSDFAALTEKNSDTLYFITNEESGAVHLYLGEAPILGASEDGGENSNDLSLEELSNVLINNIGNKDILVYNKENAQWENVSFDNFVVGIKEAIDLSEFALVSDLSQLSEEVSDLELELSKKANITYYTDDDGNQVAGTFLSPDDKAKLDALVIEEDGDIAISGSVSAANVEGLSDWIANNRDKVNGLLSTEQETKLQEVEKNYINSVDTDVFSVTSDRQLLLKAVPTDIVEGLTGLSSQVQNLDNILNGYTDEEGNNIEGLTSVINNFVSISDFNSAIGNLDDLLLESSSLSERIVALEETLKWQSI